MRDHTKTVAIAILCKTPIAGQSKTRLSPPLRPEDCAEISACFIRDLSQTINSISDRDVTGYAVYTPLGTEDVLREFLPERFGLVLQGTGDLGARLHKGISDLLSAGHAGAVLVNSDSPTMPESILRAAVDAVAAGDNVVLGPAIDGGYTLVGLSRPHERLFDGIPWSTDTVLSLTIMRARELDLPVVTVPAWYDVDDESSLKILQSELTGTLPPFAVSNERAKAPATRNFLRRLSLLT